MIEGNFIPWDDMLHKKYTKEQMLSFAKHCMVKLLTKCSNGKDISSSDLDRINQILNQNKDKDESNLDR